MKHQSAAIGAFDKPLRVVHPRVVAAQMTPPNQIKRTTRLITWVSGNGLALKFCEGLQTLYKHLWSSVDLPIWCPQTGWKDRLEIAQVDSVRLPFESI